MRFGVAIPAALAFKDQIRLAKECDEADLSIWAPDERFFRDVFVTLSAFAQNTVRSPLATGVTDPQIRHPLLTAVAAASVNELSGGRAILGIGAGISGFDALGIKRQAPATAIRDMIRIVRRFWDGEAIDFEGPLFSAHGAHLHFRAGRMPIYVAGRGPKVLAAGGELAEGVVIGHMTSKPGIGFAREHIDRGRSKRSAELSSPEIALWAYTSVSLDGAEAKAAVKPAIGRSIRSSPELLPLFGMDLPELEQAIAHFGYSRSPDYDDAMRRLVPDALALHLSISGTPAECIEQIRALRAFGIDHLVILPYPPPSLAAPAMVDLFRREVLPHVADL